MKSPQGQEISLKIKSELEDQGFTQILDKKVIAGFTQILVKKVIGGFILLYSLGVYDNYGDNVLGLGEYILDYRKSKEFVVWMVLSCSESNYM